MKKNITLLGCLFLLFGAWATPVNAENYPCTASSSWVTNPNPPEEIPKGKNAEFCEFYQFSWQWFLQLISPSTNNNQLRNFEVVEDYPILQIDSSGNPTNSCNETSSSPVLFIRTMKSALATDPFNLPRRTGEAGGGDTIYDQNRNVVFFDIRFSKNMCDIGKIQSQPNFPSGTTEIKTAWKVISASDKGRFYWIEADIDGIAGTELLGLIGFHLVRATTLHPEFVWATFEHKDNNPDCSNPQTAPAAGWSFTSAKCSVKDSGCTFNKATPNNALTGTPTEICRVYPYGTDPSDHEASQNLQVITKLNDQIVGSNGYLTKLPTSDPLSVFQNYFIVGAMWENDITKPSSVISNQRGSMRLTNTVAETTFQHVDLTAGFVSNCFGCHNYKVATSNTLPTSNLSHIFDDVIKGVCISTTNVEAGPIWSNVDAQTKCPNTCSTKGGWAGGWVTTVPNQMSVCFCCND